MLIINGGNMSKQNTDIKKAPIVFKILIRVLRPSNFLFINQSYQTLKPLSRKK